MSESEKNILDAFFESKTRTKIPQKAVSQSTHKPLIPEAKKKDDGWVAGFEKKVAPNTSTLKGVPQVKNLREIKGSDSTEDNLLDSTEASLDAQKKVVWNPNPNPKKTEKGPSISKKSFPTLQDSLTITTTTERSKPKDKEK